MSFCHCLFSFCLAIGRCGLCLPIVCELCTRFVLMSIQKYHETPIAVRGIQLFDEKKEQAAPVPSNNSLYLCMAFINYAGVPTKTIAAMMPRKKSKKIKATENQ